MVGIEWVERGSFITSDGVLITNRHMAESVPDGSLVAYNIFGERLGGAKR